MRYFMEGAAMSINKKSNYERYLNQHGGAEPTCPVCGKEIRESDLEKVEYIKTKRGTVIFVHTKCVKKWGK